MTENTKNASGEAEVTDKVVRLAPCDLITVKLKETSNGRYKKYNYKKGPPR